MDPVLPTAVSPQDVPPPPPQMNIGVNPVNNSATPPPGVTVLPKKSPWGMVMVVIGILLIIGLGIFAAGQLLKMRASNEPVTITWWGLWEPETVIRPILDEFQAANPKIKVNYVFQSHREYRERLQNALASGQGPDVFRIHNSWVPMFNTDLDPVPADVFSAQAFESTFYPAARSTLQSGSNYMAVPLMYDGLVMFVNDDLLSKAGKTVPTSWEEMRQTAIDLTVCDSEDGRCRGGDKILVSGASLGVTENVDHWQDVVAVLMLQNNVNLNSPVGQAAEEALQFYTIFSRSDHMWDSSLPNSTAAFAGGKVGIYFGPSWRIFDILDANPTLKFSTHPLPQLPLDPARGEKPVAWGSFWAEGVSRKSAHTEAAWSLIKFLSTPETLQKMYQQASLSGRAFGEIFPRQDMASLVQSAEYVGAFVQDAPNARSWYLASFTHDGATGINSLLSKYFEDAVNGVNQGRSPSEAVKTLNSGINQVLSRYGLTAPIVTQ